MTAPSSPSVHGRVDVDLQDDGLLWLINRVVFHPRGFALGYDRESGRFQLLGDGSEEWTFSSATEREKFQRVEALFAGGHGSSRAGLLRTIGQFTRELAHKDSVIVELRRQIEVLVGQVDRLRTERDSAQSKVPLAPICERPS